MALRCKTIIASTVLLAMSGCTLVPGGHFEGIGSGEQTANLERDLEKVNIHIIDSQLVQEHKIKRAKQIDHSSLAGIDVSNYEYRLGVGDVITIGVWDHPELTIPAAVQRTAEFDGFRVQADGTINFAYAPKVPAAGRTVTELRTDLAKRLSRVIEEPQIDVKVVGFKSQKAYVTGEVTKPGVYPITETPVTLIDAINQAGGLTESADWETVTFTRGDKTEVIQLDDFYAEGDISQNRLLRHGDIVHVSRNDKRNVYVLGDVIKAGKVDVNRYGLSLAEALTDVGGFNERTADANGVFVLRKRDLQKDGVLADVYQLHAKNVASLVLAEQFELEPQDIVYVTSAPLARWNKVISLLLPSLSTVDAIQDIENQ
ncbi:MULTISPECIES: polysaccharide export protein [Pseudoalteromonas]|uniref:polysaccharide export protein n=1 Tax=Pseudoalteromonas TaxID=53246 RepID=UPI00029AA86C|nr:MULTISPECIES: polysaccharide export protein [Pseudoalteromonas]AUJ68890.1 Polysaccharide biosynthesis/export protein [Pseudoalteromonas sp. NC201]MCF2825863.1 polysaccharide biosynthesis/export family protein [Pseudoalteromonas sp. OF5H-5]MCF2834147.1 polysaccharide biosynthesis/export family protein [Pseudoalteromonas sp. DL2-H6]MCF2927267.1 polysaccharide biosynthesis/export family protein [Pseudoalteromonas sp. DL2-H1]MCF7513917.1 polysaccharide biosynthesis/export family protein [Pseudo